MRHMHYDEQTERTRHENKMSRRLWLKMSAGMLGFTLLSALDFETSTVEDNDTITIGLITDVHYADTVELELIYLKKIEAEYAKFEDERHSEIIANCKMKIFNFKLEIGNLQSLHLQQMWLPVAVKATAYRTISSEAKSTILGFPGTNEDLCYDLKSL